MTGLVWVLVGLPAGSGAALVVGGRRVQRLAGPLAVGVAAVLTAVAVTVAADVRGSSALAFLPVSPVGLQADALAVSVAVMVTAIALLVLLVALREIEAGRWRFFGLMLGFISAVLLTVFSDSLFTLLAGWEVMGATSYALIAHDYRRPETVQAGQVAFIATRAADLGLYLAAGAALAGTARGGSGPGHASDRLGFTGLALLPTPWLQLAAAGVLVAALGKAAQLPFSFWLSGAMRGPSPVSALLHSAAMVAMGGYLLLRLHPLLAAAGPVASAAAWIGAITAVVLGAVALFQRDLKQLLAASTSAQLGFVVLAAGVTTHGGAVTAGLVQLIAHAATKALLFLVAGIWLHALGTRQLAGLRGVARRWPVVGVCFTIGALSLAGIVPLSLWAAKESVLAAAREQSLPLYITGLLGALLAAGYAARAAAIALRGVRVDTDGPDRYWDTEQQGTRSVSRLEQVPLVLLAAAAAVLGLLELPAIAGRVNAALGDGSAASAGWGEVTLSTALAIAVAVLLARVAERLPYPRWAATWMFTRSIPAAVARQVLRFAHTLARIDDSGLNRVVNAAGPWTRRIATGASRLDDRGVDGAVAGIARGIRRLGGWARLPQTGQVHQYYVQAALLLAAAVVLLAVVR